MATWVARSWEPSFSAPTRAARRGGQFRAYVPDLLEGRPLVVPGAIAAQAAAVETKVRALPLNPESRSLEGLSRFLLRSEAIASSRIEGMQVSAQQLAYAELAQTEDISPNRFSQTARLVANNITILRSAASELASAHPLTVDGVNDLHQALLTDERHHGIRSVQNWIGGNEWNPLDAEFVPPPPESVPSLLTDLIAYASGGAHSALIQAALVHAQFETIHPFTDGNGRVGRALIHTVLTRRGLTPSAVLPISMVLLTRSDQYLEGLTSYRYSGAVDGPESHEAVGVWFAIFLDAVDVAADQVTAFMTDLTELRERWTAQLAAHRAARGVRETPRADSAVARVMELLPEAPLVTTSTVRRMLGVSGPAALGAVDELADAGIVKRKSLDRGTTGYFATELFDLVTFAERRLASTRWDTRRSRPSRPVPARPQP